MTRTVKIIGVVGAVVLAVAGWLAYDSWRSLVNEREATRYQGSTDAFDITAPKESATLQHSFSIEGIGNMFWFMDGAVKIRVEDLNGILLWQGKAMPVGSDDLYGGVTFKTLADVGAYRGAAKIIITPGNSVEEWASTTSREVNIHIE